MKWSRTLGRAKVEKSETEVDGQIEVAEGLGQKVLFAVLLVDQPHQRAGRGLDRPRTGRQQEEREIDDVGDVRRAEEDVPQDVGHGEVDDGLVAAQPAVGDEAADDRQAITSRDEHVDDERALVLRESNDIHQVERQERAHAVIRRPLGELAGEDEPEAPRVLLFSRVMNDMRCTLLDDMRCTSGRVVKPLACAMDPLRPGNCQCPATSVRTSLALISRPRYISGFACSAARRSGPDRGAAPVRGQLRGGAPSPSPACVGPHGLLVLRICGATGVFWLVRLFQRARFRPLQPDRLGDHLRLLVAWDHPQPGALSLRPLAFHRGQRDADRDEHPRLHRGDGRGGRP